MVKKKPPKPECSLSDLEKALDIVQEELKGPEQDYATSDRVDKAAKELRDSLLKIHNDERLANFLLVRRVSYIHRFYPRVYLWKGGDSSCNRLLKLGTTQCGKKVKYILDLNPDERLANYEGRLLSDGRFYIKPSCMDFGHEIIGYFPKLTSSTLVSGIIEMIRRPFDPMKED